MFDLHPNQLTDGHNERQLALQSLFRTLENHSKGTVIDSGIFVFGLLAQWMQARKKIENWPFWIVLDLIAAGVYALRVCTLLPFSM